jgi:hypothetical protein
MPNPERLVRFWPQDKSLFIIRVARPDRFWNVRIITKEVRYEDNV